MTFADGKICYLEIPTSDFQASAAFYRQAFSWRIRRNGEGATAFDDTVGGVSGMWVTGRQPSSNPGLVVHIMVADIEAAVDAVTGAGGAIAQPFDPDAGEKYALFRDPAGNVLGIYQENSLTAANRRESPDG